MASQAEKGLAFRALHEHPFVIPNPWDIATTRILTALGFKALATTSAGYAFSRGKHDHGIERAEMIAHIHEIASATALPVSADLGNGFGDDPAIVAETIRLAAEAGVVGASIEDSTNRSDDPLYSIDFAVERIRAAVAAARALPFPFTVTARAENYLVGKPDRDDTIKRLQAYQEAGADVLYAPCVATKEDIAAIVAGVGRPVNVLMGANCGPFSLQELADLGVTRFSVGADLTLLAYGAIERAGREMLDHGTFTFANDLLKDRSLVF